MFHTAAALALAAAVGFAVWDRKHGPWPAGPGVAVGGGVD
jgi:hypothetical protein